MCLCVQVCVRVCRCVGVGRSVCAGVWMWVLSVQVCGCGCLCVQVCGCRCCLCRCVDVDVNMYVYIIIYSSIYRLFSPSLSLPSSHHLLISCILQLKSLHPFAFGDSASDHSKMQGFVRQLQEVETHSTEYVKSVTYIPITHTHTHTLDEIRSDMLPSQAQSLYLMLCMVVHCVNVCVCMLSDDVL